MCDKYKYILRPLKYDNNAYEPSINAETMALHHDIHLQKYIDNLNIELEGYPRLRPLCVENIPAAARRLPAEAYDLLAYNSGGVFCHNTYFDLLMPPGIGPLRPQGQLGHAIKRDFSSFEGFVYSFKQAALGLMGSGWVWLCADLRGRLSIETTRINNMPNMARCRPVLILDMWEHAYYLTYRYNKGAYIDGYLRIINWEAAEKNFEGKE